MTVASPWHYSQSLICLKPSIFSCTMKVFPVLLMDIQYPKYTLKCQKSSWLLQSRMVQICGQWMKTDKLYPKISTVNEKSNCLWRLRKKKKKKEATFVIRAWEPDKKIKKYTMEVRLKNYSTGKEYWIISIALTQNWLS